MALVGDAGSAESENYHKYTTVLKITGHRRLLITLIVILAGILFVAAWLVWPEPTPKDINLRLKFVGSGDLGGKAFGLFRVEGAERYDIIVKSYRCIRGTNVSPVNPAFACENFQMFRIFRVENQELINHGWQLQASVAVVEPEREVRQFLRL